MNIGLHKDISEAVYRAADGVNFSRLKLFRRAAAHARHDQLHPPDQTAAMALGSATHAAILEPESFELGYCRGIKVDKRTTVGKAAWAEFVVENASRAILDPDDWDSCIAMRDAAWAHPLISEILKGPGMNEVVAIWDDPETGLRCKARMDRISAWDGWTWAWDVKTTRDASPRGFRAAIANYDMHCQAAHYLNGLTALADIPRRCGLIAIEKEAPHCPAIHEICGDDLDQGRYEVSQWMLAYKHAQSSGVWAGYPAEIHEGQLPQWRRREYEYGE
jgi:hypothetical protein